MDFEVGVDRVGVKRDVQQIVVASEYAPISAAVMYRLSRPRSVAEVEASGGYQILYADAAWLYSNQGRGGTDHHYETVEEGDLLKLPVARIAAKDAVLFHWATWPNLPAALATMTAWGFEYKTVAFVWLKHYERQQKISEKIFQGQGFWTRSNTEFVLLGVRGDLRRLDTPDGRSVHQIVETWVDEDLRGEPSEERLLRAAHPREIVDGRRKIKHSAKPAEVRERIVQLMGDLPRLEMFARERVSGWDAHGLELESSADVFFVDNTTAKQFSDDAPETFDADAIGDERESEPERRSETEPENRSETTMATLPKALAQKVGEGRVAGGGTYINHGDYVMMIKKWWYQQIQDECIILEVIAIESRKKTVYEGDKPVTEEPNAPGSECSTVANFSSEAKQSAPGNARAPVLALFGFKEGEVANDRVSQTLEYVTSDAQPAAGMLVTCSTFSKEIRSKKGNYITGLNWDNLDKPVAGNGGLVFTGVNAPDKVAARLAALRASPEELVRVATEQLRGAGVGAPVSAAPSIPSPAGPPAIPGAPPVVPTSPPAVADVLAGWTAHPNGAAGSPDGTPWYYKGTEIKTAGQLRAAQAVAVVAPPPPVPTPPTPPSIPTVAAPPVIPMAPAVAADPLAGWTKYPDTHQKPSPDGTPWFYKGTEVKTEGQIRAGK